MVRVSYVQGLLQRRVKYRFDLERPTTIGEWVGSHLPQFLQRVAVEWGAETCPASFPSLSLLLINWRGATLPADLSICAPVSHPPVARFIDVAVKRVDLCLEPIAPMAPPLGYVSTYISTAKQWGRVTPRGKYLIVKYRGLLFATGAQYGPDARGGVVFKLARYGCFQYQLGKALRLLEKILK